MVDADTLYFGAMAATLLGGLALRNFVVRRSRGISGERNAQEQSNIEELIQNTTTLGTMQRIYQKNDHYVDQQGREVPAQFLESEVLKIDCRESVQNPRYKMDKLEAVKEFGESLGAHYFSVTGPSHFNQHILYSILFHGNRG